MAEIKRWTFWRAVLAEFLGMLLFIFFALCAIIGKDGSSGVSQEVKVTLAFALAIATLAQTFGHISGAHLNPAVTLGLLVSCQISVLRCVCYILAQMLGAVTASAIVNTFGANTPLGVNALNKVTPAQGFAIEFFATLQLVLCVIAVTDKRRNDIQGSAPLAIGLSVGLGHLAAISFTGCGINPARSFGPAVIRGKMANHWVYWVGPMCGGIVAALIYEFLQCPRMHNFRPRFEILLNGHDEENDSPDLNREEIIRPGPSQWPKQ
eukprot:XP_003975420.1 PREDICTED: aquaporin-1-like [Takifugu rubripes]